MKKKLNFSILIFFVLIVIIPISKVFAVGAADAVSSGITEGTSWSGYSSELNASWTKKGDTDTLNTTRSIMGTIITVFQVVGTGIAIIMLTYLGIHYMFAAPSEKADFKKSATAYIVGAVILFAASGLLGIIASVASGI